MLDPAFFATDGLYQQPSLNVEALAHLGVELRKLSVIGSYLCFCVENPQLNTLKKEPDEKTKPTAEMPRKYCIVQKFPTNSASFNVANIQTRTKELNESFDTSSYKKGEVWAPPQVRPFLHVLGAWETFTKLSWLPSESPPTLITQFFESTWKAHLEDMKEKVLLESVPLQWLRYELTDLLCQLIHLCEFLMTHNTLLTVWETGDLVVRRATCRPTGYEVVFMGLLYDSKEEEKKGQDDSYPANFLDKFMQFVAPAFKLWQSLYPAAASLSGFQTAKTALTSAYRDLMLALTLSEEEATHIVKLTTPGTLCDGEFRRKVNDLLSQNEKLLDRFARAPECSMGKKKSITV